LWVSVDDGRSWNISENFRQAMMAFDMKIISRKYEVLIPMGW